MFIAATMTNILQNTTTNHRHTTSAMRAVGVRNFGGADALEVLELPEAQAGPGEVRIRVHAAAVNPTDTLIRSGCPLVHSGGRQPTEPPYVPGMDTAGVIDQVGSGVGDRLALGQRVVALLVPFGTHGAYAEQVVVPAASVVAAPSVVDLAAASTLLMNGMTARLAVDALGLSSGETVAVTGAAGIVGGYAVQLAKLDGLRVIADAKPADEGLVRSLGADDVVERGDDVGSCIRKHVSSGVRGIVDGALLNERVLSALADGGTLATVRGWSGPTERGLNVRPVQARSGATDTAGLQRLVQHAEDGALRLRVAHVLSWMQASEAHRMLEAGDLRGRVVLDFS